MVSTFTNTKSETVESPLAKCGNSLVTGFLSPGHPDSRCGLNCASVAGPPSPLRSRDRCPFAGFGTTRPTEASPDPRPPITPSVSIRRKSEPSNASPWGSESCASVARPPSPPVSASPVPAKVKPYRSPTSPENTLQTPQRWPQRQSLRKSSREVSNLQSHRQILLVVCISHQRDNFEQTNGHWEIPELPRRPLLADKSFARRADTDPGSYAGLRPGMR